MPVKPTKRRNRRTIGFSEEEMAEIQAAAKQMGLYPRQFILLKIRGGKK